MMCRRRRHIPPFAGYSCNIPQWVIMPHLYEAGLLLLGAGVSGTSEQPGLHGSDHSLQLQAHRQNSRQSSIANSSMAGDVPLGAGH